MYLDCAQPITASRSGHGTICLLSTCSSVACMAEAIAACFTNPVDVVKASRWALGQRQSCTRWGGCGGAHAACGRLPDHKLQRPDGAGRRPKTLAAGGPRWLAARRLRHCGATACTFLCRALVCLVTCGIVCRSVHGRFADRCALANDDAAQAGDVTLNADGGEHRRFNRECTCTMKTRQQQVI